MQTGFGEGIAYSGTLALAPLASEGTISASNVQLVKYQPYYADLILYAWKGNRRASAPGFRCAKAPGGCETSLSEINLGLKSVRLRKRGEREDFLRAKSALLSDTSVDVNKLVLNVGKFTTQDGLLNVIREPDGALNVTRILPAPAEAAPIEGKVTPWQITLNQAEVDRWKVTYTDLALPEPVKVTADRIRLRASGLSNEQNRRGQLTLQARLDPSGSLAVTRSGRALTGARGLESR